MIRPRRPHVEVTCSDPIQHRRRVETRVADIAGLRLPTWQEELRGTTNLGGANAKFELVNSSADRRQGSIEWIFRGTDHGLYKTGKRFSVRGVSVIETNFHIMPSEWQALLVDFRASLDKFKVTAAERKAPKV